MFKDLLDNHVTEQVKTFKYPGSRMSISKEFDQENKISFATINSKVKGKVVPVLN
jgi:hypothetical protein